MAKKLKAVKEIMFEVFKKTMKKESFIRNIESKVYCKKHICIASDGTFISCFLTRDENVFNLQKLPCMITINQFGIETLDLSDVVVDSACRTLEKALEKYSLKYCENDICYKYDSDNNIVFIYRVLAKHNIPINFKKFSKILNTCSRTSFQSMKINIKPPEDKWDCGLVTIEYVYPDFVHRLLLMPLRAGHLSGDKCSLPEWMEGKV